MYRKFFVIILLIELLFLTGCLNFKAKDDPTRFYMLSSVVMEQRCTKVGRTVGVARVVIPDYLDRAKIVTEVRENEFNVGEFHCWAESIDRGITRVMVENLSSRLCNFSVLPAPWRGLAKPDLELHVHILEFKSQLHKCETLLVARYYITNVSDGKNVCSNEVCVTVPFVDCGDYYLDVVASMNEALAGLSREIADKL